jgi:ribosomal protein S18 acetylase RimI-like enzyme
MTIIRKATSADSSAIASCLLIAMEDIIYKFIGEQNSQQAKAFMEFFVEKEDNQYSYTNCWVAEDGGRVVGAINIYDGALLVQLRQPVLDHLKDKFQRVLDLEDETQPGEFYLDTIGVHPDQQGKGIGTRLLQYVVDDLVVKRNKMLVLLF